MKWLFVQITVLTVQFGNLSYAASVAASYKGAQLNFECADVLGASNDTPQIINFPKVKPSEAQTPARRADLTLVNGSNRQDAQSGSAERLDLTAKYIALVSLKKYFNHNVDWKEFNYLTTSIANNQDSRVRSGTIYEQLYFRMPEDSPVSAAALGILRTLVWNPAISANASQSEIESILEQMKNRKLVLTETFAHSNFRKELREAISDMLKVMQRPEYNLNILLLDNDLQAFAKNLTLHYGFQAWTSLRPYKYSARLVWWVRQQLASIPTDNTAMIKEIESSLPEGSYHKEDFSKLIAGGDISQADWLEFFNSDGPTQFNCSYCPLINKLLAERAQRDLDLNHNNGLTTDNLVFYRYFDEIFKSVIR